MNANRSGSSLETKAAAAVAFAQALNSNLGEVTQAEFNAVREAGYSDAQIVEIITHVGMNILTNLVGKATQVDIDFPKVSLEKLAA
jgi:alkylhydroperoxidase family enzyme